MNTKDLLALSLVKGIGSAYIKSNLHEIRESCSAEAYAHIHDRFKTAELGEFIGKAESILADCQDAGIEVLDIQKQEYPHRLFEINDPPPILYVKGNKSLLDNALSIVGTRKSSALGNQIASRLGEHFGQDFSICNGLVKGIDEHAVYSNGKILPNVIGVISGGLCYRETCSQTHQKVIEDVLFHNGLIVSECHPKQKEDRFSGIRASRIQAGLSKALILVQSSKVGGSKYTVSAFSRLNRTLGVVYFPDSPEFLAEGFEANRMIVEGKLQGLAAFVGLKKCINLNVKSIVPIRGRGDYDTLVQLIQEE
ncbi:MAG: DNA-processing protein DprA [Lentimicrobiaceae bacterium]|nr:DNA-processing protein DprA [Lentimicrobiaceae bacterium]